MVNFFKTKIEDPKKVWLTSDTHFFHSNILQYCGRPFASVEEMNQKLIENWNCVVGPDDEVYHLGDICFGNKEKWESIICAEKEDGTWLLNGRIHLILGNHDPERLMKSDACYHRFEEVCFQKYLLCDGWEIYLNHFPFLDFSNNFDRKVCQFHGHIHSGPLNTGTLNNNRFKMLQWNQYDVGVDNNNYRPISLEDALNIIKTKVNNNE